MRSIVSCGTPEAMPCLKTLSPAWRTSQAILTPVASMILRVASTHSGPMPSPGMRVTSFLPSGVVAMSQNLRGIKGSNALTDCVRKSCGRPQERQVAAQQPLCQGRGIVGAKRDVADLAARTRRFAVLVQVRPREWPERAQSGNAPIRLSIADEPMALVSPSGQPRRLAGGSRIDWCRPVDGPVAGVVDPRAISLASKSPRDSKNSIARRRRNRDVQRGAAQILRRDACRSGPRRRRARLHQDAVAVHFSTSG